MPRRSSEPRRLLTTVLFTDIVDSTKRASELGDTRWRQLLTRHHAVMRRELRRHHGREIDTAGDGFFATFAQPSDAIECAEAMIASLARMGVRIRAGVHMGEVEMTDDGVSGIAVHVGARVMSKAGAGEIMVSSTVRELMPGSDLQFVDAGFHELKGVEPQVHLFSVRPAETPVPELEAAEGERAPRRRLPVAIVAAVTVVAVAAVAFALFGRSGGETFVPHVNTVAELDRTTGEVIGGATVGTTPKQLAYGDGRLWVANFDDKTVQSIDVSSGVAEPAKGGVLSNPTGIAVGGGAVWVTNGFAGQLVRFDPRQPNDVSPTDVGAGASGVAFGFDRVWVAQSNTGEILVVDPLTDDIRRIELRDAQPVDVAVGNDLVWVADATGRRVVAIDPQDLSVARTVPLLSGRPTRLATGGAFVWVTSIDGNSLTRIEQSSGRTTTVADVGNGPLGVAADAHDVWVANSRDGSVVEVDAASSRVVRRVKLGFSPDGVALTPSGVWVSLHAL
jgi:class 3 adenylate cyclase/sugar lactone lactonase YvrE